MKTMNIKKVLSVLLVMLAMVVTMAAPAFADEPASSEPATTQSAQAETEAEAADSSTSTTAAKAFASAIAVGLAAAGGAVAMGVLGAKSSEAIARQPEAEGKLRTSMMLPLVFIETAIIYALLVVILIIFVL